MIPPLDFTWDGEALVPARPKLADHHLVAGERYTMVEHQERSGASHRHYFASVREAWQNLPEEIADRFPSDLHLRKHALIQAGYRDERSIVCSSKAEAARVAAFVRPMDDHAVVIVREGTVLVLTAKSQSVRAMGKKAFQESKDAVLAIVAGMIGSDPATLSEARAA